MKKAKGENMKNIILVILFLSSFVMLISTIIKVDDINYYYHPELSFYSDNFLSVTSAGKGYTGTGSFGSIETSLLNPASLLVNSSFQLYFESGTKSDMDYIPEYRDDYTLKPYKNSSLIGLSFKPIQNINMGIIYGSKNSVNFDLVSFIYDSTYETVVDSFANYIKKTTKIVSVPISYHLDNFTIGMGVNFEIYDVKTLNPLFDNYGSYELIKTTSDAILFKPSFGFISKLNDQFQIGSSFIASVSKSTIMDYKWYELKFKENTFPWELRSGVNYSPKNTPINFNLDYRHIHTSEYEDLLNRNDFFVGSEYVYKEQTLRIGYFSQVEFRDTNKKYSEDEYWWLDTKKHDKHFLTFGGTINWKSIQLSLAYLTSAILSPNEESQNLLKFSIMIEPS